MDTLIFANDLIGDTRDGKGLDIYIHFLGHVEDTVGEFHVLGFEVLTMGTPMSIEFHQSSIRVPGIVQKVWLVSVGGKMFLNMMSSLGALQVLNVKVLIEHSCPADVGDE
jgi:hypothetical protein